MTASDLPAVRPGLVARLVGVGAILGAIVLPLALGDLGATLMTDAEEGAPAMRPVLPLAASLLTFSAALATLERRAARELGLSDLVGDLTIGTATVLVAITPLVGSYVLLGPGFVLLFVGSVIFGVAGFDGKRRPRWGSTLVGVGAGGLLATLLVVAAAIGRVEDIAGTALLCLLLYSVGWAMLGLHLALARPLVGTPDAAP